MKPLPYNPDSSLVLFTDLPNLHLDSVLFHFVHLEVLIHRVYKGRQTACCESCDLRDKEWEMRVREGILR